VQLTEGAAHVPQATPSEIALSLVILFSAGLLTRTLSRLKTIDLGFNPERVLTLKIDPAMNGYSPAQSDQIFDEILSRLRAQPGIAAASLAVVSPLEGSMISLPVDVPGHTKKSSDLQTNMNTVSPDYFKTLSQKLLAGRDFSDADVRKAPGVAIVNQLFVQQFMRGLNPLGQHIKVGVSDTEIIGLVRNARYQTLREQPWPLVYLAVKQTTNSGSTLLVRTRLESSRAIPDIQRAIRSVAPRIPIYDVRELQTQIDQGISAERVLSFLSALFSALATLLCCIGIYGLIAYAVGRRTREIGVRFAVGAQKIDIAKLFVRESAILVCAGILVGIPLALASTRILDTLLYGIAPGDPATLGYAAGLFLIVGLLASLIPVMRAARVEVLSALRYE
jgi:predicted permease